MVYFPKIIFFSVLTSMSGISFDTVKVLMAAIVLLTLYLNNIQKTIN